VVAGLLEEDEGAVQTGVETATTKEEKNAFAMTVLRRIRTKLEGREPGAHIFKVATLYSGGDDTTRPRRQGICIVHTYVYLHVGPG
jgi:hypothetical protein